MKINGVNHQTNLNPYKKSQERLPIKEMQQKRDQVEISDQAKRMQQDSKVQRREKVEALKQQVEAGSYHVDAEKIAKKFQQYWSGQ